MWTVKTHFYIVEMFADKQEVSCLVHHELESFKSMLLSLGLSLVYLYCHYIVITHTWSLGSVSSRSKAAFPDSSFHRSGTGSGPAVHILYK